MSVKRSKPANPNQGFNPWTIPKGKICSRCNKRKATKIIAMGGIHGGPYEYWCEYDLILDKLTYAEKQAAKIPDLKAKLENLK